MMLAIVTPSTQKHACFDKKRCPFRSNFMGLVQSADALTHSPSEAFWAFLWSRPERRSEFEYLQGPPFSVRAPRRRDRKEQPRDRGEYMWLRTPRSRAAAIIL